MTRRSRITGEPSSSGTVCGIGFGTVIAVALDSGHHFSKHICANIDLQQDHGVAGDAHAGPYVRHRYLGRRNPRLPNLRQVHLIDEELLLAMGHDGYDVRPGELGENIITKGLYLEKFPLGARLATGKSAVVELTGLRTPCVLIDRFRAGLKRTLMAKDSTVPYRARVLGIVRSSGRVAVGDAIAVSFPGSPTGPLPPL